MLELRHGCECCHRDLPPDSAEARICSFECTFCASCADAKLGGICPNCGGELVPRPRRSVEGGGGRAAMKYHHVGIPTRSPRSGETHLDEYCVFCTDHESNPFGIQWMRYEEGCRLPELVKTVPHVAFEVDDLERALAGHEILIPPNSPSPGVLVAFVVCDGAPVEFLQFLK